MQSASRSPVTPRAFGPRKSVRSDSFEMSSRNAPFALSKRSVFTDAPLNAPASTASIPAGNATVESAVQPEKAPAPRLRTESGNVTSLSPVQPLKALSPIDAAPPKSTDPSAVQPENALAPTDSRRSGKAMAPSR